MTSAVIREGLMTEPHLSMNRWISTLETEAAEALRAHDLPEEIRDDYRVTAERCDKHDDGCVKVRYGFLARHVRTAEFDPTDLALALVAELLRPSSGPPSR